MNLQKLVDEAMARFNALPPEEQAAHRKAQQDGYVRAEMSWPKPNYHWEGSTKVYHSWEDYFND